MKNEGERGEMRSQVQKVCLSVSSDGGKMIYGFVAEGFCSCDARMLRSLLHGGRKLKSFREEKFKTSSKSFARSFLRL